MEATMYDHPTTTTRPVRGSEPAPLKISSWVIACFCGQLYKGPVCPRCAARTPEQAA
jgi:hypothetical protein